jgi:circadian clock protein KaiB
MRQFCEQHLEGRYQLDVIEIYQQRSLARSAQIIATPTLVKYSPFPKKVWVGDLSNTERILAGLDLPAVGPNPTDPRYTPREAQA